MQATLETGLQLSENQPDCITAVFTEGNSSFQSASDARGDAFVFDRAEHPATLIEVIHTKPKQVRGNHIHRKCKESFNVLRGSLEFYLLCDCLDRHVFCRIMQPGDSVLVPEGIAHAMYSLEKTEFVAIFSNDPRDDRERVPILVFS